MCFLDFFHDIICCFCFRDIDLFAILTLDFFCVVDLLALLALVCLHDVGLLAVSTLDVFGDVDSLMPLLPAFAHAIGFSGALDAWFSPRH